MIPFFSLAAQNRRLKKCILTRMSEVIDSSDFCNGRFVKEFEDKFSSLVCNYHTCAVSSGSAALILGLRALNLDEDTEVIVPANTFIATALAPIHLRLRTVFVDCSLDSATIDITDLKRKITRNTRCVIGVHLYGNAFSIDEVLDVCSDNHLFLLEDCAQAYGTLYKGRPVGTFGDIGCFSFYPSKNIGSYGESGAVITKNLEYDRIIRGLRNHGSFQRYYHELNGYNMKMDSIQAVILFEKLKIFNELQAARRMLASFYYRHIKNEHIHLLSVPSECNPVHHLFVLTVCNRNKFIAYMRDCGIETAIHYPVPCHLQKCFSFLNHKRGDIPNSEYLSDHVVSIPFYPELPLSDAKYVADVINSYKG